MEYKIKENDIGKRLDVVVAEIIEKTSRSTAQKLIESEKVLINHSISKASYKVKDGDIVTVEELSNNESSTILPEDIDIEVLYEDEDIIVVNKPKNMVVHPAVGNYKGTLVNALLGRQNTEELSTAGGEYRPGIIHRLDKDTTGVLVIAKNNYAHETISKQIKERTTKKEYVTLVRGLIKEDKGTIDLPIGRSPKDRKKMAVVKGGRNALTEFSVMKRYEEGYTLVNVRLRTGRTHQIRVHFSYIGYPVVGDSVYSSGKNPFGVDSQMLHSHVLGFIHPTTNKYVEFEAPIPKYFSNIINELHEINN